MSDSLRPHEPQHPRPPCPSPTPGVHPNPWPLSRWCHPTISSSVVPFSSCPQSLPASGSFQMSQLFASDGQSIGVSASTSALSMNTQAWSPYLLFLAGSWLPPQRPHRSAHGRVTAGGKVAIVAPDLSCLFIVTPPQKQCAPFDHWQRGQLIQNSCAFLDCNSVLPAFKRTLNKIKHMGEFGKFLHSSFIKEKGKVRLL